MKVGEDLVGLGVDFLDSFIGVLGDRRDISFWVDRWVDNTRICDRFPRLYHLDRRKEDSVFDKGSWVNEFLCWEGILGAILKDKWRWRLVEDGEFTVKYLARFIKEKIVRGESGGHETLWNNLVPKKVNIFVLRALKGRLLVRVELDRRDIDLDPVLCPCCNDIVETWTHSLVTCDLAMSVWDKVFNWWKVGMLQCGCEVTYESSLWMLHSVKSAVNENEVFQGMQLIQKLRDDQKCMKKGVEDMSRSYP
ncbi:RNA-directed DNA polymerase, eukaryota, reverse transcriptase zinc-binding domain protein [Tanacetum coccineum]